MGGGGGGGGGYFQNNSFSCNFARKYLLRVRHEGTVMMFKVDNKDKIMMYSFCSGVFIVNLGHMSLLFYVSYVLKIKCLFTKFGVLIGTYSKILLSPVTDVLTLSSKMCPVKGKLGEQALAF